MFWAIYYNDSSRLSYYKKRFEGVKIFISPDYSAFDDINKMENLYRIWKARIVSLWFTFELGAVVIPNISYVNIESFPIYFSGLENCSVVAFSTKSHLKNKNEKTLFKAAVKYATDHLPLKTIVIYSACGTDMDCLKEFKYASDRDVKLIIPNNTLRSQNMKRRLH